MPTGPTVYSLATLFLPSKQKNRTGAQESALRLRPSHPAALFLLFCMKLAGGLVVVLVYGWNASDHGHTDMPWTDPNLLVCLFLLNSGVLSLSCYLLGRRRFRRGLRAPSPAALRLSAGVPLN